MARRTKQEAQETRTRLLDAAEQLFFEQGVAQTSLAQIAAAAGSTRGAIYWHFKDKSDLFNAMMDRQTLPFEETLEDMMLDRTPLQALRDHAINTLERVQSDASTQRVLSIAMLMVEMVPEHLQIRERHQQASDRHIQRIHDAVMEEHAKNKTPITSARAKQIGLGLHSLIFGLMYQWLLAPTFDLKEACQCSLDAYLIGCGLNLSEQNR